jgi:glyoxylase-like metal-dependent hydrolase (beta-lactamase superfamily II)
LPRKNLPTIWQIINRLCDHRPIGAPLLLPLPVPYAVRVVNAYLLLGEPLTLVDPGADWAETRSELEAGLAAHGLRLEDVERIVITHQHHDHAGLAHWIKERSGAEVVAHHGIVGHLAGLAWDSMEAEDQFQAGVMRLNGVAEERIQELYDVSKAHRVYGGSVAVDIPVAEGDTVRAGTHTFVVHERPGHSPSDLVLVDEHGEFALGGDHLIATISSNPVVHRPLDRPADPRERPAALVAYLDSLRRTAALDIGAVLPGHGPPVTDHGRLVGERMTFHERRKERVVETLGQGRATAHELALEIWGEVARKEPFLTLSEALGHLDLLERDGRVAVVEDDDGRRRYERS